MTPIPSASAPPRSDLPFLRHRTRPQRAPAAAATTAAPALADFLASRSPRPSRTPARATPATPQAPATPPAPAPSASVSSDLDLSVGPPTTPATPRAVTPQATSRPRADVRTQPGTPTLLTAKAPTVTLTRMQSAIGALTVEALFSESVGDLRIGCAYQLRSGASSTAQRNSTRPIILDPHGRTSIDLRQCREIERLMVYGFSESRAQLRWGGTLVVTTFGNAKIEVPLDRPASSGVVVLLSLFNVRGEFVIRAEQEEAADSVRDACNSFGYERITWRDDRNPVD